MLGEYDRQVVAHTRAQPGMFSGHPHRGRQPTGTTTSPPNAPACSPPARSRTSPPAARCTSTASAGSSLTLTPAHTTEPWRTLTATPAATMTTAALASGRSTSGFLAGGGRDNLPHLEASALSAWSVCLDVWTEGSSGGWERRCGVLILAKITRTSAAGYAEYLEGKAQAPELGDYYLKDGERVEAPGRWAQGAAQFGLDPT